MLRGPRWEEDVSALEVMQGVQAAFTSDEVYAYLRSFEKTLKQAGEPGHPSKIVTFSVHNHQNTSTSQFTTDEFMQKLDHESSKDALLLSKILLGMLRFEQKYNKEREEENQKVVCFACHREGHTIQMCFKLFPHLKNKDGDGRQDHKARHKNDAYKNKKKVKAVLGEREGNKEKG
jgi:hypothetical protein